MKSRCQSISGSEISGSRSKQIEAVAQHLVRAGEEVGAFGLPYGVESFAPPGDARERAGRGVEDLGAGNPAKRMPHVGRGHAQRAAGQLKPAQWPADAHQSGRWAIISAAARGPS